MAVNVSEATPPARSRQSAGWNISIRRSNLAQKEAQQSHGIPRPSRISAHPVSVGSVRPVIYACKLFFFYSPLVVFFQCNIRFVTR